MKNELLPLGAKATRSLANRRSVTAVTLKLEQISLQRWEQLTRQARTGFYISMAMSVGLFFVGTGIIVWGLWLLTSRENLTQQIGGGILTAVAALATTYSGRFWKDPVEHIQRFSAQQARLQTAFIGYMNRVAELRLVFEHQYSTDGVSIEQLKSYQELLGNAIDQASRQLSADVQPVAAESISK